MVQRFVQELLAGGQIYVGTPQPMSDEDRRGLIDLLSRFEAEYRLSLPGKPPPLDTAAACWAAELLCRAASLVVYRDYNEQAIQKLLDMPPPDRRRADSHYAVDLTMRFLPELLKLSKSASTDDPLNGWFMKWAQDWPLSSVGIDSVGQVDAQPLRTSPSLLRLYADRIIAAKDHPRLDDPAVVELVRVSLGNYPELCPSFGNHLNSQAETAEQA